MRAIVLRAVCILECKISKEKSAVLVRRSLQIIVLCINHYSRETISSGSLKFCNIFRNCHNMRVRIFFLFCVLKGLSKVGKLTIRTCVLSFKRAICKDLKKHLKKPFIRLKKKIVFLGK